jgi:hypothetical protein
MIVLHYHIYVRLAHKGGRHAFTLLERILVHKRVESGTARKIEGKKRERSMCKYQE